ncbi:MAG TPA: hypothetical protein VGD78_00760 [Chthoniobacterales bacterium]
MASRRFHLNENVTLMGPDEDLNAQLRSWKVNAEVPPTFPANVWRAIAVRERAGEGPVSLARLLEILIGRLGQPRYAVPFGILALTVSLGLARVQADAANAKTWRTLETRYVTSVDPVAMAETNR